MAQKAHKMKQNALIQLMPIGIYSQKIVDNQDWHN